jgi:hypothetical protein
LLARSSSHALGDFVDLLTDLPAMAVRAASHRLLFPANIRRQPFVLFAVAIVEESAVPHLMPHHEPDFPWIVRPILPGDILNVIPPHILRDKYILTDQ